MQKTLFLLLIEQDLETIMGIFCEAFGVENKGEGNTIQVGNGKVDLSITVTTSSASRLKYGTITPIGVNVNAATISCNIE